MPLSEYPEALGVYDLCSSVRLQCYPESNVDTLDLKQMKANFVSKETLAYRGLGRWANQEKAMTVYL